LLVGLGLEFPQGAVDDPVRAVPRPPYPPIRGVEDGEADETTHDIDGGETTEAEDLAARIQFTGGGTLLDERAEAERVESMISELDEIESEADRLETKARDAVMAVESELPPVDAVFLYKAIELVGEIADMAERVGRRLENLLAR